MKIVHVCLANFYIDNYSYQENMLPKMHKRMGHDVWILASTETYINGKKLGYVKSKEYLNEDGILITRIAYKKMFPLKIAKKIRLYVKFIKYLEKIQPDVIFLHGFQFLSIIEIVKYAKKHNVKLFIDTHADSHNSARNWISKNILHRGLYKFCLKTILPYTNKLFSITADTTDFLEKIYDVPSNRIEYFPLGGELLSDDVYKKKRSAIRLKHNIPENIILCIHSGKMDKNKKVIELIQAFNESKLKNSKLFLIGSINGSIKEFFFKGIKTNSNIEYLGWKSAEELQDYLCACDLYIQPGGQSVTMQNAACCRCALALYPYKAHLVLWGEKENSVFYIENVEDMKKLFVYVDASPSLIQQKRNLSYSLAIQVLNYEKLASRVY